MSFTWALILDDVFIVNGVLKTIANVEEVSQRIVVTLGHNWQEYFMNVPAGIPWYEIILGSRDILQAEIILRDAILAVPGVVSILSFESILSGREFTLRVSAEVFVNNQTDIVNVAETFFLQ